MLQISWDWSGASSSSCENMGLTWVRNFLKLYCSCGEVAKLAKALKSLDHSAPLLTVPWIGLRPEPQSKQDPASTSYHGQPYRAMALLRLRFSPPWNLQSADPCFKNASCNQIAGLNSVEVRRPDGGGATSGAPHHQLLQPGPSRNQCN
jgi:hypothetical protein